MIVKITDSIHWEGKLETNNVLVKKKKYVEYFLKR